MAKRELPVRAERQFEGSVSSAAAARLFVTQFLADAAQDVIDDAVLIVSELATNAVAHARTSFAICLSREGSSVRIEVRDSREGVPIMRSPAAHETFGRGLSIVNQLSLQWGFDPQPGGGKTVWAEIALVGSPRSAQ